ncbi:MAG: 3-dehydroquinate synthase [Kiritimatiellae bacterium]|nr:3-dehydroquinate synthase [Kiritimatiellia bacterium]
MKTYEQKFTVSYDYPVHFTQGLFEKDNPLLSSVIDRKVCTPDEEGHKRPHRVMVYIDSGVIDTSPELIQQIEEHFKAHANKMELVCPPKTIPGGENAKNGWNGIRNIMTSLGEHHMCRQSYVMIIGGGSVLDAVGFAASLVHRGLRQIRIPTTVLSQNDAGVGVKNGMNEREVKNFIGCFAPPFAVIDDSCFLKTLDEKNWTSGIAEAFKVAIIKDSDFFDWLCSNARKIKDRNMEAMETLVRRCAILHLDHIGSSGDPFESGSSRPLDFGHWSAHKLESISDFSICHGYAVAIGIALDSYYAERKKMISADERDRILNGMTDSGLPTWSHLLPKRGDDNKLEILRGMEEFREHLGGLLTITLPEPIGCKKEVHEMDLSIIEDGLTFLKERHEGNQ